MNRKSSKSKPPKFVRPVPQPRILAICPHCNKEVPEPVLGPLAKYRTATDLRYAIAKVAAECDARKKKLTLSRLAYELGFLSRQSLRDMEIRLYESNPEFAGEIKRARLLIETLMAEGLTDGKPVNTAGIMFYLKNMDEWRDVKDIREEHSGTITLKHAVPEPDSRGVVKAQEVGSIPLPPGEITFDS